MWGGSWGRIRKVLSARNGDEALNGSHGDSQGKGTSLRKLPQYDLLGDNWDRTWKWERNRRLRKTRGKSLVRWTLVVVAAVCLGVTTMNYVSLFSSMGPKLIPDNADPVDQEDADADEMALRRDANHHGVDWVNPSICRVVVLPDSASGAYCDGMLETGSIMYSLGMSELLRMEIHLAQTFESKVFLFDARFDDELMANHMAMLDGGEALDRNKFMFLPATPDMRSGDEIAGLRTTLGHSAVDMVKVQCRQPFCTKSLQWLEGSAAAQVLFLTNENLHPDDVQELHSQLEARDYHMAWWQADLYAFLAVKRPPTDFPIRAPGQDTAEDDTDESQRMEEGSESADPPGEETTPGDGRSAEQDESVPSDGLSNQQSPG